MAEQASSGLYCEVCGIDVKQDNELKRFGKFFCSKEHMEMYVNAKQRELGARERRRFRGC
ncbi:hypothetical protein [Nitrososphaera sp.]|uniref:hypothetical protein n=1 Tax=Nitrososphaera sp. TaxID=1971748 RepID=UPI0017AEA2FB|nr:hypothetical protein [Nitrososphaera sp.]NWG38203.1 hypothetical protein [Nitrososphaera sp.]